MKTSLCLLIFSAVAFAQYPFPGHGGGGGGGGGGTGAANPFCTFLASATTCTINTAALAATTQDQILTQCFTGASTTQTPVTITTYAYTTGSGVIATVAPSFSAAAAAGYCVANATGSQGAQGLQGATGPTGAAGTNGTNGTNGATGPTGPSGSNGSNGATGPTGTNGSNGATGPTGPTGPGGTGNPFSYHAYTGTSVAVDFSTYTYVQVTANGVTPTITVLSPPGTSGTPVTIKICNDATSRVWSIPGSFVGVGLPVKPSTCYTTFATYDSSSGNYNGGGGTETPSISRFSTELADPGSGGCTTNGDGTTSGGCLFPNTAHNLWYRAETGALDKMVLDAVDISADVGKVIGINAVPLCSGFTPTNGQFLQYTTGGSPNPCYSAAAGGGAAGGTVVPKTANYTFLSTDNGDMFSFNGSSLTATLPSTTPTMPWLIAVQNLAATPLTIARNGNNINGSAANVTLMQGQSATCASDTVTGSNYVCTYQNTPANLVEISGSPLALGALAGTYWNNTSSAYSFDLAPPVNGLVQCFGNYTTRTSAISIIPSSGVSIVYLGTAGTAGSSTGLVSGGALGDYICVEGTDSTTYTALGPGTNTWVNH